MEPGDSLIMRDADLSTIPEKESDEEKSMTFYNLLFNSNEDFTSSDDELLSDEDVPEDKETDALLSHFNDSPPEYETYSFDIEEKSNGSTTIPSEYSFLDYEAFYLDESHIEEKSSGSTTTHSDFSLHEYDSFIFDLSIDPFPLADRSVSHHEEFADDLAHIISPPEYDRFLQDECFDPGDGANEDECFDPGDDIDEIDDFLDIDTSSDFEDDYYDSEGYIIYLESFLIKDTTHNLLPEVFLDHDPKNLKDEPDNENLKSMIKVFDPGIHEKTFSPTYVKLPFEDRHYLSLTYVT
ncbi:hypothetical protein Tco_1179301 [Tanacetum coccineum]